MLGAEVEPLVTAAGAEGGVGVAASEDGAAAAEPSPAAEDTT